MGEGSARTPCPCCGQGIESESAKEFISSELAGDFRLARSNVEKAYKTLEHRPSHPIQKQISEQHRARIVNYVNSTGGLLVEDDSTTRKNCS